MGLNVSPEDDDDPTYAGSFVCRHQWQETIQNSDRNHSSRIMEVESVELLALPVFAPTMIRPEFACSLSHVETPIFLHLETFKTRRVENSFFYASIHPCAGYHLAIAWSEVAHKTPALP